MGIERLENSKQLCYFSQVILSFVFSLLCLPPLALEMVGGFWLHFHGPSQLLPTSFSWILYFLLPHSQLWENSDNHEVSTLGVVNAYTFSWTALSPK